MTTSLLPSDALFHMTAKVFKRSEGRSAVAAAAYRSASKLHDSRTGQDFDYTRKHAISAVIISPPDAPEWVKDRELLWNRAEEAERRRDAVVARECEISVPRDIPEDQWGSFARSIAQPYIDTGAIADIAIHCPLDAYGRPQPHIHIMLTSRTLDASTESGFSLKKNDLLASIFESGGRRGGTKGEALKIERARVAVVINQFLAAVGSKRRASHESYDDRGIERVPEPQIGEKRAATVRNAGHGDRRTRSVTALRAARHIDNLKFQVEEELMTTNPKHQFQKGIRPKRQQDFKAKLLSDRFPGLLDIDMSHLHMVDVRNPSIARINTRDGGWVEVQGRRVRRYGNPGYAEAVAASLADHVDAGYIEFLAKEEIIRKRGSGTRARQHLNDPVPAVDPAEVESRADRWRSRGYWEVTEAPDGCWVTIGSCRLQDLGDELRVHGKANDASTRALLQKAIDEWGSEIEVFGSREFKDQVWLEAQRSGVTVYDQTTGLLYEPSPNIRKAFDADRAKVVADAADLADVKASKAIATLVREAASGDMAAMSKLEMNDPALTDFLTIHLDDEQRISLMGKTEAEIVHALPAFRANGRKAREDDERKAEERGVAPRPGIDYAAKTAQEIEDVHSRGVERKPS